jgi:hypothetical protein
VVEKFVRAMRSSPPVAGVGDGKRIWSYTDRHSSKGEQIWYGRFTSGKRPKSDDDA